MHFKLKTASGRNLGLRNLHQEKSHNRLYMFCLLFASNQRKSRPFSHGKSVILGSSKSSSQRAALSECSDLPYCVDHPLPKLRLSASPFGQILQRVWQCSDETSATNCACATSRTCARVDMQKLHEKEWTECGTMYSVFCS